MPFARSAKPQLQPTPGERLVQRTGLGLALFTLTLIAILLAIIGVITAAAAVRITDQSVDSNLYAAAQNMLTVLAPTGKPSDDADHSDHGDGHDGAGQPTTPPTPDASSGDRPPESADTFFLILDKHGNVSGNPQNVGLAGLPNAEAAALAAEGRPDWRTVTADGVPMRLLSEPIVASDGSTDGVLQSGFVLAAHDEQQALIVRTIVIASLIGLFGAAVVTMFVTRRAMSPIRAAFDAERRFVASASHELKTPVSIVRASAEILQREDLVSPEGRYLVDDVIAESDRLGRLVGDLLALASAEAGQISITPTVLDARPLVVDAVERVQAVARQRGVSVIVGQPSSAAQANGDELLVLADDERLLQLLMILIDNAIDHSPPGGEVEVVARAVDEGDRGGRVLIDVLDHGPGVPLTDRERIFEPFARVAGRRPAEGTSGLGLAIGRLLATRQDATVDVRDAPGGGACFSVSFARY